MKNTLWIFAVALGGLLSGCASVSSQLSDVVFMPNGNSERQDGESIEIELAFSDKKPDDSKIRLFGTLNPVGTFGSRLTDIAIAQIGNALKAEGSRYQATYSADAASDSFYHDEKPSTSAATITQDQYREYSDIKFAGFKFSRLIDGEDGDDLAMSLCVIALPGRSDSFFYIVPVSYQMRYSKAKLIGFDVMSPFGVDLLNPWEILTDPLSGKGYSGVPMDKDLDMEVAVGFEYLHYLDSGELNATRVGPQNFTLKNVPVTGKLAAGYFPAYEKFLAAKGDAFALSCDAGLPMENIAGLRDRIMALKLTDVDRMQLSTGARNYASAPRAFGPEQGNGNFTLKVSVTELDDYGKRVEEISGAFDENKGEAKDSLTDFFK